ncbi:hypothetical protein ACFL27_25790 [candidate division CSSED10-310 bacterium]|uniref:Uncharacterized protein n=1 Tax=candidate division CSSED10-310 bacterium TaxID=2855610 RepID=A0ABV6Z589_UNCC1
MEDFVIFGDVIINMTHVHKIEISEEQVTFYTANRQVMEDIFRSKNQELFEKLSAYLRKESFNVNNLGSQA